jgi:serine/threonine protein kinase
VTDFGLAQVRQGEAGLTMSGDLLGTLRYMSPEQALARHGVVDHRTDIYSLGTTLYEVLTGQPAVEGQDRQLILRRIADEEPRPPRAPIQQQIAKTRSVNNPGLFGDSRMSNVSGSTGSMATGWIVLSSPPPFSFTL